MKPVDQTPGECLMACIASILEVPLETLPHLGTICAEHGEGAWYNALQDALEPHGLYPLHYHCHGESKRWPKIAPRGYHIACGTSPRGVPHATVALDGVTVHDPHPSKDGIPAIEDWIILVPLAVQAPPGETPA